MNITQADVRMLQATRLHFCIPCYGGMITESCFMSMLKFMATAQQLGMQLTIDTMVNESLVCRARNSLVAKMMYLEPKSTHLLFVDADIGFAPEEIIKLLLADKDVIGGLYPKKALPISYVVNKIYDAEAEKDGNIVEVANFGTGFMLIKRGVIQTMFDKFPNLHYQDSIGLDPKYDPFKYALFDTMIDERGEYLSEDYVFCKRWREMGGKIYVGLSIKLDHSGFHKFAGDPTVLKQYL